MYDRRYLVGDIIPADGIILSSNELSVDESSLTGESDYVRKGPDQDLRALFGRALFSPQIETENW